MIYYMSSLLALIVVLRVIALLINPSTTLATVASEADVMQN